MGLREPAVTAPDNCSISRSLRIATLFSWSRSRSRKDSVSPVLKVSFVRHLDWQPRLEETLGGQTRAMRARPEKKKTDSTRLSYPYRGRILTAHTLGQRTSSRCMAYRQRVVTDEVEQGMGGAKVSAYGDLSHEGGKHGRVRFGGGPWSARSSATLPYTCLARSHIAGLIGDHARPVRRCEARLLIFLPFPLCQANRYRYGIQALVRNRFPAIGCKANALA